MHGFIAKAAVLAAVATSVSSGVAAAQPVISAKHILFYEKNSSLVYTSPNGKVATLHAQPAPGSQIEFTDLDYSGTQAHHSNVLGASDHFVCTFSASGNPTCNGEVAMGNSMLIAKGAGGQGNFSIPIVSGTGSFLGYTGTLNVADIGTTLNANLEIVMSK